MSASTPLDRNCATPGCDGLASVRVLTAALALKDMCRPCAVRLWSFCRSHGIGVHGWPLTPEQIGPVAGVSQPAGRVEPLWSS